MQRFRLTDLPIVIGQRDDARINQAVPFDRCDRPDTPLRDWMRLVSATLPRSGRRVWLARDGWSLLGLVAVRPREGRVAWEIDALIEPAEGDVYLLDLLDRGVATAGAVGAGRLFLRVPAESSVVETARRHGFVVVTEETRYVYEQRTTPAGPRPPARRRERRHDQALFRLYTETVPQEVRWHTALSPAEWRAAEEPLGRRGRAWVIRGDQTADPPAALVRLAQDERVSRAVLLTDGRPQSAHEAVALALHAKTSSRPLFLLLPAHAVSEMSAATEAGFTALDRFVLLVRPIAQRAKRLRVAERAVDAAATPVLH